MKTAKPLLNITSALLILTATHVTAAVTSDDTTPVANQGAIAHTVTVEETMNSGGYTYAQVKKGDKTFWIAAPMVKLKKGETISFYEQMMMEQFTSKTLQRTFKQILFVSAVSRGETLPTVAASTHNTITPSDAVREPGEVTGRFTVADLYGKALELSGKTIEIKGKVAKISWSIMGRNWVHIQDGTGEGPTSNIVFRSVNENIAVGDEVVAKGIVELNKNFGFNYFYPVIVEDSVFSQ